jgi:hypothetical protein
MFRFTRVATLKNAVYLPAAVQFGIDTCGYLNKAYGLNLSFGVEMFGGPMLHWQFDTESLDAISALTAKMLQDRQYLGMLEKVKDIWLEGALKDTVTQLLV